MAERLAERLVLDPATGCLNWTGTLSHGGYGQIGVGGAGGKTTRAHRAAYELAKGPIPPGLVIDHLCRNPKCCNPDHLEAVTQRENTLRGIGPAALAALASHCPQGHPYDEGNTYTPPAGGRRCRTCAAENWARHGATANERRNAKRAANRAAGRGRDEPEPLPTGGSTAARTATPRLAGKDD